MPEITQSHRWRTETLHPARNSSELQHTHRTLALWLLLEDLTPRLASGRAASSRTEAPASPRFSSLARRLQEQERQLTPHKSITNWPCQGGRFLLNSCTSPFQHGIMVNRETDNGPQPQRGQSSEIPGSQSHVEPPGTGTGRSRPENCRALSFQLSFTFGADPHLYSHSLHRNPFPVAPDLRADGQHCFPSFCPSQHHLLESAGQTPKPFAPWEHRGSLQHAAEAGGVLNQESTSALSCPFLPFPLHNSPFPCQESRRQQGKLPSCSVFRLQFDHALSRPDRGFRPQRMAHGLRRGDPLKDQAALSISRIISGTKHCEQTATKGGKKNYLSQVLVR